jgi:hypothetical protein
VFEPHRTKIWGENLMKTSLETQLQLDVTQSNKSTRDFTAEFSNLTILLFRQLQCSSRSELQRSFHLFMLHSAFFLGCNSQLPAPPKILMHISVCKNLTIVDLKAKVWKNLEQQKTAKEETVMSRNLLVLIPGRLNLPITKLNSTYLIFGHSSYSKFQLKSS